ncbi:MAG: hypothetical protein ABI586_04545 [Candidatus Nanopelagicales bacterium]
MFDPDPLEPEGEPPLVEPPLVDPLLVDPPLVLVLVELVHELVPVLVASWTCA